MCLTAIINEFESRLNLKPGNQTLVRKSDFLVE